MEFQEIGKELGLGGLTEAQVRELAKFGKGILDHAGGLICLQSGLLGLVKDVLKADDFDLNENRLAIETVLHIVSSVDDLIEECWSERKTPLALIGSKYDNDIFGLKEATIIQML